MDPVTDVVNTPPTDTQADETHDCRSLAEAVVKTALTLAEWHALGWRGQSDTIDRVQALLIIHFAARSVFTPTRTAPASEATFTADEVIQIANETSDSFGNLYRLDFIDRIRHDAAGVPAATHTAPAAQALVKRLRARADNLLAEADRFDAEGGSRRLAQRGRDRASGFEIAARLTEAEFAAQAPAPTPGQRTVQVVVFTDEPGPDVTEVEGQDGWVWERADVWHHGPHHRTWAALSEHHAPLMPVGTRARLRGDA